MSAIAANLVKSYSPGRFWSVRLLSILFVLALLLVLQFQVLPRIDSYDVRLLVLALLYGTLAVSLNIINGITGQFSIGHAAFYMVGAYSAGWLTKACAQPQHYYAFPPGLLVLAAFIAGGWFASSRFSSYLERREGPSTIAKVLAVPGAIVAVVLLPYIAWIWTDFSMGGVIFGAIIVALIAYPVFRWINVDRIVRTQAAIGTLATCFTFVIGAVVAAFALNYIDRYAFPAGVVPLQGWQWVIAVVIIGAIAAGVTGFVVGLPSLRLKGDYLAIVTLGFGEIARIVVQNQDGGSQAFGFPAGLIDAMNRLFHVTLPSTNLDLGGAYSLEVGNKLTEVAYVALLFIVTVAIARNVLKTSHGLSFLSVREDELAASAVGVNTTRTKVTAFVLGAAIAGMAGALFALFNNTVAPDDFKMDVSFLVVAMVVIGGTGSITGAALAAIGLKLFEEALRNFSSVPAISLFAYVIAIILMVIFAKYSKAIFAHKAVQQVLRVFGYLGCVGLLYVAWLNLHASVSPIIKTAFIAMMLGTVIAFVFTAARASLPKFGMFIVYVGLIYVIQVPIAMGLHHVPVIESQYNNALNPVTYTPSDLRWAVYALSLVVIMLLRPQGIMGHHELSWSAIGKLFGKKTPQSGVAV